MTYEKTINSLKQVLNNGRARKGQNLGQEFIASLKELKEVYGQEVSTKFLKGLISLNKSNRQKTQRVTYLLRKSGLKTQRQNRYKFGWASQNWNTEIKEYGTKKEGLIYEGFPRGFFNEQMLLVNEEALNRRNAINKGGGVYVKDIRMQNIGKSFKANSKEVLYFLTGY